jgi:ATPase subunit of ABC transporter with duplicated ATPase domains
MTGVEIEGGRFAGRQTLSLGDVTALWGVNDAGKSTTLATLALLLGGDAARAARVCGLLLEADTDEAEELAARSIDALMEEGALRFEVDGSQAQMTADDWRDVDTEASGEPDAALRGGSPRRLRRWGRLIRASARA